MNPEDHIGRVVAECLLRAYRESLTRIIRIIGVAETVEMLRANADALESAAPALEAARERRVKVLA